MIAQALYKNPDAPIDERVEDLLQRMTLYEKIGQMTQLDITLINKTGNQRNVELVEEKAVELIRDHHIGSFLNGEAVAPDQWYEFMNRLTRIAVKESRLEIPIIYGIDHMHGASYLSGSTIFPHNINLGATFDESHSFETARITAIESADLGHHWTFAPVLDLGLNPYWPRFWETYGEDPHLASVMGAAYVRGYQNNEDIAPYRTAATSKHFLAYSNPASGWDRSPVQVSMQMIHEMHRPSFQAAINAGLKTVMLNSGEINGVPVHASKEIVTGLLREKMGFDGVVVTDWDDIGKLVDFHKVAEDYQEATYMAIEAGIDMNMTPTTLEFNKALLSLVKDGRISKKRINESVRRILKLKFDLGLFEHPYPRNDRMNRIGMESHRQKALRAAEESLVVLKNDGNVLPLKNPDNILLFGPCAKSKRNLAGGWTIGWQGGSEDQYPEGMNTLCDALQKKYPNASIHYADSIPVDGTPTEQKTFLESTSSADLLIYAAGEEPYTEFVGNVTDLRLPGRQLDEIALLNRSASPTVLIMIAGRPRIITDIIKETDAFIFAGLPGFEGADAIANLLSGTTVPSGKLPFSYPQHTGHFVNYHHKPSAVYFFNRDQANVIIQDSNATTSLFEFGDGLSYTTFEYDNLVLSATEITAGKVLTASVTITNTGDVTGKESVLWFISDLAGRITRPVKILKHFEKVELAPGEKATLTFEIQPEKILSYPDSKGIPILEPGRFTVNAGPLTETFILK
ncbi:glycoside hydrolase family 3 N-terminal domain-containing protein [Rhodohalobacter mucosus]|uniref:beta-glucosidase n=1 Tax=Rhodohalobacter mucosus TaxID=2079485 RepID=A0A316TNQ0_9BACT|nr:glycoside hydrolase family 3 N-terminal domain-containing protein [Rhodohalobacter mucosus]PWN06227.1 beta-glucosidase [Rhodohalobacter mucosus]